MADKVRLLLACSDPAGREHLARTLGEEFETIDATNVEESSRLLAQKSVSLVFCEDRLPGGGFQGLQNEIKRSGTSTPVVVLSRTGDWEEYLAVLRMGAFDMVIAPYDRLAVQTIAYNALQESRLSHGARAVEALPRIAPRSAVRAVPNSAHPSAWAAAGGMQGGIPAERTPRRELASDGLPEAGIRKGGKETSSILKGCAGSQGKVPEENPAGEHEGSASSSSEMGG